MTDQDPQVPASEGTINKDVGEIIGGTGVPLTEEGLRKPNIAPYLMDEQEINEIILSGLVNLSKMRDEKSKIPRVFFMGKVGASLSHLIKDEKGGDVRMDLLSTNTLAVELAKVYDLKQYDKRGKVVGVSHFSAGSLKAAMEMVGTHSSSIPTIRDIVDIPVVLHSNGRWEVIKEPGYHEDLQLLNNSPEIIPMELGDAVRSILEFFENSWFVKIQDFANALACLFALMFRDMSRRRGPIYIAIKPEGMRKMGASDFIAAIIVINTGKENPSPFNLELQGNEFSYQFTSYLMENPNFMLLENLTKENKIPRVITVLSSEGTYSGRPVGRGVMLEIDYGPIVMGSSNGFTANEDLQSRVCNIGFGPPESNPEAERWTHPDGIVVSSLQQVAMDNRRVLLSAMATIAEEVLRRLEHGGRRQQRSRFPGVDMWSGELTGVFAEYDNRFAGVVPVIGIPNDGSTSIKIEYDNARAWENDYLRDIIGSCPHDEWLSMNKIVETVYEEFGTLPRNVDRINSDGAPDGSNYSSNELSKAFGRMSKKSIYRDDTEYHMVSNGQKSTARRKFMVCIESM